MKEKICIFGRMQLLLLLLAMLTVPVWAEGSMLKPEDGETHEPYIQGRGGAVFAPGRGLTRGETASLICSLIVPAEDAAEDASETPAYSDVPSAAWYAGAVADLGARGIMNGYEDITFRPAASISRAEFVSVIARIFPEEESATRFADVPEGHWAENAIGLAADRGWISGYPDGTFRPYRSITRAEAVVVLNAVLGRDAGSPETRALVQDSVSPFIDVRPADWFYPAVLEASTEHTFSREAAAERWETFSCPDTGLSQGLQRIGGALYQVDGNGQIVFLTPGFCQIDGKQYYVAAGGGIPFNGEGPVFIGEELYCQRADGSLLLDGDFGCLHFDTGGKYTTGKAELDAQVKAVLAHCTNAGMTGEQRLRAAYVYLRDACKYFSRAHHDRGSTDWTEESALFWFANRKGNCYCYAAVMMYLARQLGYQAQAISGGVGKKNTDHAWVMIDGYLFDPEYEYQRGIAERKTFNLYHILPEAAPFRYYFPQ